MPVPEIVQNILELPLLIYPTSQKCRPFDKLSFGSLFYGCLYVFADVLVIFFVILRSSWEPIQEDSIFYFGKRHVQIGTGIAFIEIFLLVWPTLQLMRGTQVNPPPWILKVIAGYRMMWYPYFFYVHSLIPGFIGIIEDAGITCFYNIIYQWYGGILFKSYAKEVEENEVMDVGERNAE